MSPKVSVMVRTYNHAAYIGQALESALAQRTSFEFEIVVGENASTDGAADLIRRLQAAHPGRIRATFRPQNVGLHRNFIETYRDCRAPYIAYLDGDDYWLSPDKLQRQVELLDARPDWSMCFSNAYVWTPEGGQTEELMFDNPDGRSEFGLSDLVERNFLPMCSILARNGLIESFPVWFSEVTAADDWVVNLLMARHGGIGFLPEPMAVYRRHPGGAWSGATSAARSRIFLQVYDRMPEIVGRQPAALALARALAESIRQWQANRWFLEQTGNYRRELENYSRVYAECKAHNEELEKGRRWLEGQVENYRAAAEAGAKAWEQERARAAQLFQTLGEAQAARAFQEAEADRRQAEAEAEADRRQAEAEARADRLRREKEMFRRRLARIEGSRVWRFIRLLRRVFDRVWRRPMRRVRGLVAPPSGDRSDAAA
jgi:glycosyltransferase involved in cell wall biosynthesis